MPQYIFGSGTVFGKRTDVANTPPVQFGVLKDISIDMSKTLKELVGQYQVSVAIGAGQFKVTGKASFARITASAYNNLFFGQTLTAGAMLQAVSAPGVSASVPAPSGPYTVTPTVPSSGTFIEDMGVYYSTTGTQLVPVASGPTIGQYSVNNSTGVYTFSSADASTAMNFFFSYTVASGNKIVLANQLMGVAPNFSMTLQENFSQYGVTKVMNVQLNYCVSSKMNFPFKNEDFMMSELDFIIGADAAGNWGTISVTDP